MIIDLYAQIIWVYLLLFVAVYAQDFASSFDNSAALAALIRKLPVSWRSPVRNIGISLAALFRIGVLFAIPWINAHQWVFVYVAAYIIMLGTFGLSGLKFSPFGGIIARAGYPLAVIVVAATDVSYAGENMAAILWITKELPVLIAGMLASVVSVWWFSRHMERWMEKWPTLEKGTYFSILVIGVLMLLEYGHTMWPEMASVRIELDSMQKSVITLSILAFAVLWDMVRVPVKR